MRPVLLGFLLLAACSRDSDVTAFQAAFRIISPSPDGVANEARPLVRWTQVPGSFSYRVRVYADATRATLLEQEEVRAEEARLTGPLADGRSVYVEVQSVPSGLRTGLRRFRILLLPESFPALELVRDDAARSQGGYKLFNLLDIKTPPGEDKVPAMVLVNRAGEVVWWYVHPGKGILTDPRVLPGDTLTFIVRDNVDPKNTTSVGYEITWDGTVVWRSRPGALLHHELAPGPDSMRLYMVYLSETVGGVSYESDGLELVDPATNQVLWTWSVLDHFRPQDFQVPEIDHEGLSHLGVDWSHANAAVWDPARSLIWVSIRHFDRIVGVDYPSGEIRVTLGKGGLGPPDAMSHQHAPEVEEDGSILFWDNGNTHVPPVSRVKMFSFDESSAAFAPVFEWEDDPPFFDFALGDADRLPNGDILATAGVSGRVIEIDLEGRIVWELRMDVSRHWIYRTQQVPDALIPSSVLPFAD